MSTDRAFGYWITKNCDRSNCWIVVARIGEMILHENTTIYNPKGELVNSREQLPLSQDTLQYVYLTHFTHPNDNVKKMVAVVQDNLYYYLIENEEGAEGAEYKSIIKMFRSLKTLVASLSGGQRKKLGLKLSSKIKLKAKELQNLQGVISTDFVNKNKEEQIALWKDFAKQQKERLDLSGLFVFDPSIITEAGVLYQHQEIVVYQNNKFHTFQWLKMFPKVKNLSIWYVNTIQDADIEELASIASSLESLEFHSCPQLTGRILIPISKIPLNKLIINNINCIIQEKGYETIITDAEWEQIHNEKLDMLLIDSYNLTLDFINFTLKKFTNIEHFIMNEIIMKKLSDNSTNGLHNEKVHFHSVEDTNNGFTRNRNVRIYDLVRNKCGNFFSDSMLRIIESRCPEKAEAARQLMS